MKNGKKVATSVTSAVWVLVIFGFFALLGIDAAGDQGWLNEENAKMLTIMVAGGLVATIAVLALIRRIAEKEGDASIEAQAEKP